MRFETAKENVPVVVERPQERRKDGRYAKLLKSAVPQHIVGKTPSLESSVWIYKAKHILGAQAARPHDGAPLRRWRCLIAPSGLPHICSPELLSMRRARYVRFDLNPNLVEADATSGLFTTAAGI
jgi:hypothetical protein